MASTVLLVGTRKGLWIGTSDAARVDWQWTGPHFDMEEVYSCMVDTRGDNPRLLVGASSSWTGPQVWRSDDLGASWQETPGGAVRMPDDIDASVERVWQLVPGTEPGVVYAGTEPGAVFRSTDGGESFELLRGLWNHPHRTQWGEGFGGQAFHTILPHPADPQSLTVAISTGGVYQTDDGGETWQPRNDGIRAEFLPEGQQYPEFGQCVHKVARHPDAPDRLFLQNHGGVYRSDDQGGRWESIADGLPADFGFPMVVHPHNPETIFVFPIQGGDARYPVDAKARVWRSTDAGASWQELGTGLPEGFFVAVMRDAMDADSHDPAGLYFGGRNGGVFASADAGETWREIVQNLPDVMVVRAATL
ncbi:WD40/YVTN/BNR-like repeat-containing protein [Nocardioides sp. Root151]|uniref:WD40/YVTN/BNR-like repeat-containing protein n=1 Tax=Nocardioides sp. Root151 TaxID=1736475 RepID=UPI000703620D|nr:glycosyl hydrolase [Nocardioides sp. Root151]KQZ67609.1 glycosyl hydrolase [Nocardioides sp. Root151]